MSENEKHTALAAIEGLTLADCLGFFDEKTERSKAIAELCDIGDEEFEVDTIHTSEGEENGSYMLGWRWVSFSGTKLDKTCSHCCEIPEKRTEVKMRDGTVEHFCDDCLADIKCPGCGAVEGTEEYGTVGDGFDGYCPSCADKREENGEVEVG